MEWKEEKQTSVSILKALNCIRQTAFLSISLCQAFAIMFKNHSENSKDISVLIFQRFTGITNWNL